MYLLPLFGRWYHMMRHEACCMGGDPGRVERRRTDNPEPRILLVSFGHATCVLSVESCMIEASRWCGGRIVQHTRVDGVRIVYPSDASRGDLPEGKI